MQVLCSGGVAAAVSALWGIGACPDHLRMLLPSAFLGSLASAAADTWATEVGMLSTHPPRLITTWKRVPRGTSGGISPAGSAAAAVGAALVAGTGARGDGLLLAAAWVAGVLAMFLDSVLGATVQAAFVRPDGSIVEESAPGAALIRGVPWITNPVVNLLSTLFGAAIAVSLYCAARTYLP